MSQAPESRWLDCPVTTLLVDLDGTLLASRDLPLRADFVIRVLLRLRRRGGIVRAFRALRAISQAVGHPAQGDLSLTNADRAARAFAREMGLSLEEAGALFRSEIEAIFPLLERYFYPVDGAREFLDWARPRYCLVLATNPVWPIEQVELRLRWAGIDPGIFDSITHSGRMHASKPSVDYYRELLAQEGLDARECVLVGDDLRKDLPATLTGVPVFILSRKARLKDQRLRLPGAQAQARRGTYGLLRTLLEEESR